MGDKEIKADIREKLREIWSRVNPRIPLKSLRQVVDRIVERIKKYNQKKMSAAGREVLKGLEPKLFDISTCDCSLPILNCSDYKCHAKKIGKECNDLHIMCFCTIKIPVEDRAYLKDQKQKVNKGKFQIGRKDSLAKPVFSEPEREEGPSQKVYTMTELTLPVSDANSSGSSARNTTDSESPEGTKGAYNVFKYQAFILEVIRYQVSNEAAAAIGNALLKDMNILSSDNALDPQKIASEKQRIGAKYKAKSSEGFDFKCIGADGKIDNKSMVEEELQNGEKRRILKKVEHLTFTMESG